MDLQAWTKLEAKVDELLRRVERLERENQLEEKPLSHGLSERAQELGALLAPSGLASALLEKVAETQGSLKPGEQAPQVSRILGVVAVVCFVLAGAFLMRLAIQSGWLTPERQWGCGVVLGLVLSAAGRFWQDIEEDYRSYLSIAGVSVLYLAALSSSLYFNLTPKLLSLVLGMGVSGLCLALYQYHRSEWFALLAAVGTYVSPVLLRASDFDLTLLAVYFVLWAGLFAFLSGQFRSRTLSLLSAYLGMALFTALTERHRDDSDLLLIIGTLVLQFGLALWGVVRFSVSTGTPLSVKEAWGYFPALCFFYGTTYFFLSRLSPAAAPWIGLAFAALLLVGYGFAKRRMGASVLPSSDIVQAFLALALFHAKYLQILPAGAKPWLIPLWIGVLYVSSHVPKFPRMSVHLRAAGHLVATIEFLKLSWGILEPRGADYGLEQWPVILLSMVATASYYLRTPKIVPAEAVALLGMSHILALLTLYRAGAPQGSFAVSLGWVVYSALVLGLGYRRKDLRLSNSSLLVLLVATLKALTYDAAHASPGVRVLCLLATGGLLYGSGLLFRRIALWSEGKGELTKQEG